MAAKTLKDLAKAGWEDNWITYALRFLRDGGVACGAYKSFTLWTSWMLLAFKGLPEAKAFAKSDKSLEKILISGDQAGRSCAGARGAPAEKFGPRRKL